MIRHVVEPDPQETDTDARVVILGVAASDAHAVANHLIAHGLRELGFHVVNLGTCTSVAEFAAACSEYPQAEAVLVGSLNGHIHEDLRDLPAARAAGEITCPVIVGGNLSVGSHKDTSAHERLYALGVDRILGDADELPRVLDELIAARRDADADARRGVS
ncbi:cobalamin-dependent protein [Streptacidiphilus jiangxiensis]|uniref:Methylaspartate mutase sigma subunit n=1 Tax=Streptacidiphilus jiangxiensis TaxID=235985 RepID=A0A1H7VLL4_STRJI|nr:cobalamin-dependent protein [Streptacidiphilus jiangxiensis]SEM10123.1 methylaspartate mutase sigma subunit [Streptacidiphilus jiangxiensis]